ncbi:MAG: hypothetical protein ABR510_11065 [Trueperaceae bacterium]
MHHPRIRHVLLALAATLVAGTPALAQACTKYVSEEGSGRVATLERPARDLGNIAGDLEPGDVVCITGGVFNGRADSGADRIEVPVEIYGGFAPDFSARDPWGAHVTVLTGVHNADNFTTDTRLTIDTSGFATRLMVARGEETEHRVVVDGLVIDHGDRNYYAGDDELRIIRQGTPAHTPTPESGGLNIRTGVTSTIVVRHVIVMNTAPTQGAFAFFPGAAADVTVEHSLAVNNTGFGFHLATAIAADDPEDFPRYAFRHNAALFTEKHDPFGTIGGSAVALEGRIHVEIANSVLAFSDAFGLDNARRASDLVLTDNVFLANAMGDYQEFDTVIDLENLADWALEVYDAFGNVRADPGYAISDAWGAAYGARVVIDRNAAEEEVAAVDSWANTVRGFFGWNLQAADLDVDSAVWLPRMSLADALATAIAIDGTYGPVAP